MSYNKFEEYDEYEQNARKIMQAMIRLKKAIKKHREGMAVLRREKIKLAKETQK